MTLNKKALPFQIALLAVLAVVCGLLLRNNFTALVLCLIGIYSIAVSGLDVLFGYTGQISFGHAGFYAIGAYTSAICTMRLGIPSLISLLLGSIVAMAFGFLIAVPASKLVKHFLSLLTIAFGQMVFMFANSTRPLTGGASGLKDVPPISFFGVSLKGSVRMFPLIVALLVVMLILKSFLIRSRTGRAFIAIRENTVAAYGMGIHVRKYKIMAFAISAFLTGLAGALYAHLIGFISPETFMATQSTLFMTMLLFGGLASLTGPVIGSAILLVIREAMQGFAAYQMLIYALFILVVLFLLPTGTVGLLHKTKDLIVRLAGRGKADVNP